MRFTRSARVGSARTSAAPKSAENDRSRSFFIAVRKNRIAAVRQAATRLESVDSSFRLRRDKAQTPKFQTPNRKSRRAGVVFWDLAVGVWDFAAPQLNPARGRRSGLRPSQGSGPARANR